MIFRKICFPMLAILMFATSSFSQAEKLIPSSRPGDKGQYFLLKMEKNGDIIRTLHKRVGVDSIGYTMTEVNCVTMQIRDIGYSEESPNDIKENPTKWFDLVGGSSKSDLAFFVCSGSGTKKELK